MTEIKMVVAFEGAMTRKGHKRTFWGDEKIQYLDFGNDTMGLNICQNPDAH